MVGKNTNTAIKHNMILLKNMPLILKCLMAFLLVISIKDGSGTFIKVIPVITLSSMVTIESFDDKKYNLLFSLPITRLEYARGKFSTLLIVYGATMLLTLTIYIIYILVDLTEATGILIFAIHLLSTFPLSILLGLTGITVKDTLPVFVIILLLLNTVHITSMNPSLQLGEDIILDILILVILIWISRFVYFLVKDNFLRIYSDMEL